LARREAGRLNGDGDFAGARHRLTLAAEWILRRAGDDAALNGLAEQLQQDVVDYAERLSASDRIGRYMTSDQVLMSRRPDGSSKRRASRPDDSA
jgi:hypothetical protein